MITRSFQRHRGSLAAQPPLPKGRCLRVAARASASPCHTRRALRVALICPSSNNASQEAASSNAADQPVPPAVTVGPPESPDPLSTNISNSLPGTNGSAEGDGSDSGAASLAVAVTGGPSTARGPHPARTGLRLSLGPLDTEILSIALPMLATLAAEPCAALVDTAFVGRLGAAQLAGVGVALSVYNTLTKLVQVPLLSIATTTVAAAKGQEQQKRQRREQLLDQQLGENDEAAPPASDPVSAAASAALAVAVVVGLLVAGVLLAWGPALAGLWGIGPGSDLRGPALDFLTLRAVGAPISIVLLVTQGCFRGIQDTRTPFFATLWTNLLNIALDYTLIFVVGMGVKGAAAATVIAQLLPCAWLLHSLGKRCTLRLADAATLRSLAGLLGPTVFLVFRTLAVAGSYAVATALTARAGPQAAAAHQVCNQVWLASSLLSDALAVAAQSLVARSLAAGQPEAATRIVGRTVQMAGALGCFMAAALAAGHASMPPLFTGDTEVLALVSGTVWAFVVLTQPINSMAFVWDGVLFGAGGFKFACAQMSLSCLPAAALMLLMAGRGQPTPAMVLTGVWAGLATIMLLRWLTILLPYQARTGPFSVLRPSKKEKAKAR